MVSIAVMTLSQSQAPGIRDESISMVGELGLGGMEELEVLDSRAMRGTVETASLLVSDSDELSFGSNSSKDSFSTSSVKRYLKSIRRLFHRE